MFFVPYNLQHSYFILYQYQIYCLIYMQSSSLIPPSSTIKKSSHQFKALFYKSATLQAKQIGTNICQIFTPIICLMFAYIIKVVTQQNLVTNQDNFSLPIPFNVNITQGLGKYIYHQNLQWFALDYQKIKGTVNTQLLGINDGYNLSGFLGNALGQRRNSFYRNNSVMSPFFLKTEPLDINRFIAQKIDYLNNIQLNTNQDALSDGAIYFQVLNNQNIQANLFINDCRNYQYHRLSGFTVISLYTNETESFEPYLTIAEGQLRLLDLINSAYIKTIFNQSQLPFISGIIYMPNTVGESILITSLINLVGSIVFPLSLSLLFPVFLYAIVLQKQQKLIQMMKMNGMSMTYYWIVNFIFDMFLSLLTNLIFFLFGYFILENTLFTKTSPYILFIVFFGWILAQIGMSIFFQTFISKSRTATIIGYIFSIWTCTIGSSLSVGVYMYPGTQYPFILQLLSPFGFTRIIYILLSSCSLNTCISTFEGMPTQLKNCIIFLYINFVVFTFLGIYLHEILPQQFGVAKSPFFPLKGFLSIFKKNKQRNAEIESDPQFHKFVKNQNQQDQDSQNQRLQVIRFNQDLDQYPLVCNNLRKLYKKQGKKQLYAAVKSFNLIVQPNTIFGLLGPNGAGKTTLISIITGMFEPDHGNAWISGHSIIDDLTNAQLQMGVCPQFDLLWPQLTVQEHLYFYARLKGIGRKYQQAKVHLALQQVNLEKFKKFKSKQLSGGMKRRLSVAISMVGDPKIVFLDQPTTGLDPDNRRSLWSVLSKCKQKRAMFLTTHMMDEADALCNRIGIITNGILRTVSNQIRLKNLYGGGYRLDLNLQKQLTYLRQSVIENQQNLDEVNESGRQSFRQINRTKNRDSMLSENMMRQLQKQDKMKQKVRILIQFMNKNFDSPRLMKVFNSSFIYKLGNKIKVSEIFQIFEKNKKKLGIAFWGVSNSSLEDVFMAVLAKYDQQQILEQDVRQSLNRSGIIDDVNELQNKKQQLSQSKVTSSYRGSHNNASIMST